ncbi:MAG: Lin1244/Lin1753 domain-containing protein [Alkalispirochaeta sp.]
MKNNIDYFTHYTRASRNRKFKALRARYGYEGQGRFWHLNEIIAESDNCRLDLADDLAFDSLADDLSMRTQDLQEFLTFLEERCRLIQRDESGAVTTEQVQEDLLRVMQTREAAQKRREKRQGSGNPPPVTDSESSPTIGESSPTVSQRKGIVTEQNAQRSVAERRVDNSSVAKHATTLDSSSIQRILGPVVDLREGEDAEFAANLNAQGLDEAFLRWFVDHVRDTREERGIKSVKGFIVAFCRSPGEYKTWTAEYREASTPRPRKTLTPTCPACGGVLKTAEDRGKCLGCKREYERQAGNWVPVEATESAS